MSFEIKKYNPKLESEWNKFISASQNATFLHNREYMDYHKHRFDDFSLMIYKKTNLLAVLPAHKINDVIFAHKGLTYADFLFHKKLKTAHKVEIMAASMKYLKQQGFKTMQIKIIPSIFHRNANEINSYIYTQMGARLILMKPFFMFDTQNPYKVNQSRQQSIDKLEKEPLSIDENGDLEAFWKIVNKNLAVRHNTKPVHNIDEIKLLKNRFEENIRLYSISLSGKMLAGVLIFLINDSMHFQYIQATNDEKYRNAVDILTDFVIKKYYDKVRYISFGSSDSTDNSLQAGLVYWKESFGAKSVNQMFFEVDIENYKKLADIL